MPRSKVKDYYKVLGVSRDATGTDIKSAFRTLAKRYHPDHNPGNPRAEEHFKRIQEAYGVLSNKDKKPDYDRQLRVHEYLSQFRSGATTPRGTRYKQRADGTFARQSKPEEKRTSWLDWLFGKSAQERCVTVELSLEQAFRGGPVTIPVPQGKPVRVTLPEGVRDGYTIRIKDISGPPLLVRFKVVPHKKFKMQGNDLLLKDPLRVGALDAMLGGTCHVAHPAGKPVSVIIPPGTQPEATLRVRGKGVRGGDMILKVQILVPTDLTTQQRKVLHQAAKAAGL